jgi:hypothetical protein
MIVPKFGKNSRPLHFANDRANEKPVRRTDLSDGKVTQARRRNDAVASTLFDLVPNHASRNEPNPFGASVPKSLF